MRNLLALRDYWWLLTRPGRFSLILQIVLLSLYLLAPRVDGIDPAASRHHWAVALGLLLQFQLFWCGWSEQLYGLRRHHHAADEHGCSGMKRLLIDLYGGFLFLAVVSVLASMNTLLGIGAMFFLFTSVEALDLSLAKRPLITALVGGVRRSFRLVSKEAMPFLGRLLFPGMVLYATSVGVAWMAQWSREQADLGLGAIGWLGANLLLGPWLLFFVLAQVRLQLRATILRERDPNTTATTTGGSAQRLPARIEEAWQRLERLERAFERWCHASTAGLALLFALWVVFQLERNGLLTPAAFVLAFQELVVQVTSIVQAFMDLLLKLGFLFLVIGVVVCGVVVVIGLGQGSLRSLLQKTAKGVQNGIKGVGDFLASDLKVMTGATLGLGTLITALSTVAVQTYANVQKVKQQGMQQEKIKQERKLEEAAAEKAQNARLDELEKQLNQRLKDYLSDKNKSRDIDQRTAFASDVRAILHEIDQSGGDENGMRKGGLLRHLYEAGQLTTSGPECDKKLLASMKTAEFGQMQQREAEKQLSFGAGSSCLPGVFLDSMNFSGANLKGAFLERAFLPFINLSNSNLQEANLQGATLFNADLQASDLSSSNLGGANLDGSVLVGVDLADANLSCDTLATDAVAFYAHIPPKTLDRIKDCQRKPRIVSWELAKVTGTGTWTFCPLDPENSPTDPENSPTMMRAGAKCMNRQFIGGKDGGKNLPNQPLAYKNYNWSGGVFTKAIFKNLSLNDVDLVGANLAKARFENVRLNNVDFSGADLQGALISNSTLENINFTGADLRGLKFERVRSRNLQFRGVLHDPSLNLGPYNNGRLRQIAYGIEDFESRIQNEPATFAQDVLSPLLFAPLPLRPLQLLYWMLPSPLPLPIVAWSERE